MEILRVADPDNSEYKNFITKMDQDFIPALSQRDGGIEAFINIVFENGGMTWLASDETGPVGSLSFWLNEEKIIYVWFIGICAELRSTLRGGQIIMKLMSTALAAYDRESPESAIGIHFTTWESNSAAVRLYQLLGFRIVGKKEHDMVESRTTLFFEGDFELVRQRLLRMTRGICE